MKVLVTGAAAGLGLALTRQLVTKGHFVVALDALLPSLENVKREFPRGTVRTLLCDVTDENDIAKARGRLRAEELPDVVVNNAAIGRYGTVDEWTAAQWRRLIDVNLTGPFLVTKTFLTDVRHAKGKIINIGSTRATTPAARYGAYCASKFGLRGFSQCLALDEAPDVSVSIVEIGPMLTDFGDRMAQRRRDHKHGVPILAPSEVAQILVELIAGERPWVEELSIIATKEGINIG